MKICIAAILLAALPAHAACADAQGRHRYTVTVDAALQAMNVTACFADGLPERLVADAPLAVEATTAFHLERDGRSIVAKPRSNAVILPHPSDDGCISWRVDLGVVAAANRMNIGYRAGNSLILSPGTWLWRPLHLTGNRDIEFAFVLPPGMRVSVPWRPLPETNSAIQRFVHDHSPLDWSALMAIGELEISQFDLGGARFRLAIANGPANADAAVVNAWLRPAAAAITHLWGEFPVDHVQLLVVPLRDGRDAAPWAQTNRGGGAAAHFFMNTRASMEDFRDDWIATHELAHFALPFIRRSDAWLSEGFASYYQNVLRARAGMMTEEAAWQALHDGFMRGNRNTQYDTLRNDTLNMHAHGRVMRVYWSGAAIALLADVELRRRSNGEWSLDRVLEEFNHCCRARARSWSARELFAKFDALTGMDVFDSLYERTVYSRHFPRLAETWEALGVDTGREDIRLLDDAAEREIRLAIMRPRTPALDGGNQRPARNAAQESLTGR